MFEKHMWIRVGCECELTILERIESNVLKWFGDLEKERKERL